MAVQNVVGLFDNASDARGALQDLRDAGFSGSDISFVANNSRNQYGDFDTAGRDDTGTEAAEGAGFGAAGGAVLGGLTGLLVGLGSLAIPGVGPVIAAGSLATTLGSTALGAGLGAAAGGLVGALVGAGIPEEHANIYAEGVRRGGALITVQTTSDEGADRAAEIMDRHNVVDIDQRGEEYRAAGFARFDEHAEPYNDGSTASTTGQADANYTAGGDADASISRDDYARSSKLGTAGGGLAGAATGAAIGAAGGPAGAVVGGVAGAVTGGGIGAAGDAAGAEATDNEYDRDRTSGSARPTSASAIGSAADYGTADTATYGTTGATGANATNIDQGGEVTVPIVEEELRVGKREVETGGVRVNTRVEEVPVNEQVTVREETIGVQRRPVDRPVSDADLTGFQEGIFEVRERNEEVVVDKQARIVEEVQITKSVEDRTETIEDTVRRTDVDVQQLGGPTRTTAHSPTDGSSASDEGFVERTLGNVNNAVERSSGLDADRSGAVGDRDTRNNY